MLLDPDGNFEQLEAKVKKALEQNNDKKDCDIWLYNKGWEDVEVPDEDNSRSWDDVIEDVQFNNGGKVVLVVNEDASERRRRLNSQSAE